MRLIYYHENSMGETAPMIQLSPNRFLPQHMGIMGATIQDEIWVGTQPNHIQYVMALSNSCVVCKQFALQCVESTSQLSFGCPTVCLL